MKICVSLTQANRDFYRRKKHMNYAHIFLSPQTREDLCVRKYL